MKRRLNTLMSTTHIHGARDARRALARIGAESQECVLALFLDSGNRLLGRREIFRGTADMSMARPREILREALIAGATRLVVGHNHPSGDPEPSEEDVRFTVRMEWAAKAVGVHRSTIYNWCRTLTPFGEALRHSRIQAAEVIEDELSDLAHLAVDTIRQLLTSDKTPASIKLKTIQLVLDASAKPGVGAIISELDQLREALTADPPVNAEAGPVRQNSTPRNAPCPCRSGEKYKRCCGKAAPPMLYPNAA